MTREKDAHTGGRGRPTATREIAPPRLQSAGINRDTTCRATAGCAEQGCRLNSHFVVREYAPVSRGRHHHVASEVSGEVIATRPAGNQAERSGFRQRACHAEAERDGRADCRNKKRRTFSESRLCIMFRRVLIAREGAESRRCGQSVGLHAQVFLLAGISEKMHMKIRGGVLLVRPHSPSSVTSTAYFIHSVVLSHPTWNPPSPRA